MNTVSDYLYAKAAAGRIPLGGTFELSPVCNFSCKMCYVRQTPGQIAAQGKRLRSVQEWLALGKQCAEAGMLYLLLTGGEPFLYPGFRELYEQLHDMGIILSINSNGTMIDADTLNWLKQKAPCRVNVTLYGASRETYGRVCGNPEGFDRAMQAIRSLKEAGIPVVINASMIPENQADLEAIMAIGRELGLNTRVATYMFPPVRREQEQTDSRFSSEVAAHMFLRKSRCALGQGYEDFLREKLETVGKGDCAKEDWGDREDYMRCRAGRSSFWVAWDGTMTACGMTDFPMQLSAFDEPFSQAWQRLTDTVRSTPVMAGCAGCPRRELCRPCVAMIRAETGTVNEKAPYMCRMAQCVEALMREELEARYAQASK